MAEVHTDKDPAVAAAGALMAAINEGVLEMILTGAELPSINASLLVGRKVREFNASLASGTKEEGVKPAHGHILED